MANVKNLKKGNPATQFKSGRKAVESGAKGGVASGEAKREKKAVREIVQEVMEMAFDDLQLVGVENIQEIAKAKGKEMTAMEAMVIQQATKAVAEKDSKAFELLMKIMGAFTENINVNGKLNNPMAGLTTDELKKLINDG